MINRKVRETAKRIKELKIQGASNVAEQGLNALQASLKQGKSPKAILADFNQNSKLLAEARVTEPALRNGMAYVFSRIENLNTSKEIQAMGTFAINDYVKGLKSAKKDIAKIGQRLIKDGDTVLIHCHSSTVIDILKEAKKNGKKVKAICTETRPLYQGRMTAKDLLKAKIPTTMIVDSASRHYMNDVQLVLVGADAVTSTGYIINKIGTSAIALAAHEARTNFAVACSTYKFDPLTFHGGHEPIEMREAKEVWAKPPKGLKIENPAFDITPPRYVKYLITEIGIVTPFDVGRIMRGDM